MPDRFTVQHREIGMPRIFMKPSDRIGKRSLRCGGPSRSTGN
jgi:hypothetical protein